MRRAISLAVISVAIVVFVGCFRYTMIQHPEITRGQEVEVEHNRPCSDCHSAHYAYHDYHRPFHYYDPPVGSWFYRERFYGRPFFSITYHHRYQYYSTHPWWWNSRFYSGYRYREPARITYPQKNKPIRRDWDRRSNFDKPLPTVGSGLRTRESSSGTARPKESLPHFEGQRSPSKVPKSTTEKNDEEEDEDEKGTTKKVSEKKEKRSSRRKGMR